MAQSDEPNQTPVLRDRIRRVIDDMRERAYPPAYFMQALNWQESDDDELFERCKALLRSRQGQTAAFEYKRRYADGVTLEDIVIEYGAGLGFHPEDVDIARRTLGV